MRKKSPRDVMQERDGQGIKEDMRQADGDVTAAEKTVDAGQDIAVERRQDRIRLAAFTPIDACFQQIARIVVVGG